MLMRLSGITVEVPESEVTFYLRSGYKKVVEELPLEDPAKAAKAAAAKAAKEAAKKDKVK